MKSPTFSGFSVIQHTMASRSCPEDGLLCGRQIMSPREMSMLSANRMVTDIGAKASSTGPSKVSMLAMVVVSPEGRIKTSSPGRNTPPSMRPA